MAYQYSGPSLAAGGTLVKKGTGKRIASTEHAERKSYRKPKMTTKPESIFTPEQWAERLAPGWDERGWHGGGMCKVRNLKQRRRPCKGNTATGRRAHPNHLRLTK
jgi:hypothetical protein